MRSYRVAEAKEWARTALHGYVAVTFTPYAPDGDLDLEALRRDVEYLLSLPACGGIYVGSIYQEFWLLTVEERMRLAEVVIDQVGGRVPVIVAASDTSVERAIALARHAAASGGDLVMLWPPYFGPRGDSAMLDFYRRVVGAVDIGFAFYNSGLSEVGFEMPLELLAAIAQMPAVCVLKEASLRMDTYLRTLARIGDQVQVSSPLEEYWLAGRALLPELAPNFLMGSSRFCLMQTHDHPRLSNLYRKAVSEGPGAVAADLGWLLELSEGLHGSALRSGHHPVGLIKRVRGYLGQSGGDPRPPAPAASDESVAAAVEALRAAGVGVGVPSGRSLDTSAPGT